MKFCPVVPEICRGQVHGPWKERRKRIIIRNGAKTISLLVWETSPFSKCPQEYCKKEAQNLSQCSVHLNLLSVAGLEDFIIVRL
jgi:hypothetical protein